MGRAKGVYTPLEIIKMKKRKLPFENEWSDAFGEPEDKGVWCVWGNSANGKSAFIMQLIRELSKHYTKIDFNSFEEGVRLEMQDNLARNNMDELNNKLLILDGMPMSKFSKRLSQRRSAQVAVIDSLNMCGFRNFDSYLRFKKAHPNKLLVFICQADDKNNPKGKTAVSVMYDASVKVFVSGFRAYCKGRYNPNAGNYYTIWAEGATRYLPESNPFNESIDDE